MQFFRSVSEELVAGLIGTALGFIGKFGLDWFVRRRKERITLNFFGFPKGKILIIHSALFDSSRDAYNYPSCDMISARRIANMLEEVGKKEGLDFSIAPESDFLTRQGTIDPEVLKFNLILLGGPKRNKATKIVLEKAAKLRYMMSQDETGENRIYDSVTQYALIPSRDRRDHLPDAVEGDESDLFAFDYGLIMSTPNPLHMDRGVLLVAGIHGPGTVGAATFLADKGHLAEMAKRRVGGVMQQVVCAKYAVGADRVVDVTPV